MATEPVRLSITTAFGRIWVACQHGAEWASVIPTRICLDCFNQLNARTLELACGYSDGRPMTEWVTAEPWLELQDGRCE